ncbi:MAG: sugar phosphate isomerase/epimerase family protein [Thermomicrobiales bacterium]
MRLGIDTFSLRWQGWDAFQLLDYAASLGLENVHFSERGNLASLDEGYLRALKRHADDLSLTIELGMLSFDKHARLFNPALGTGEQQLMDMARAASVVGSPIVRCVLGSAEDRLGPVRFADHLAECARTLQAAAPVARDLRIKFAVENHGGVDLLARELRALIEAVGPEIVGACLDTGNPIYGGEDPMLSAEVLAPYILSTHVRDSRVWAVTDGALVQWAPVGQGDVDLRRILAILAAQAPNVPVDLEIITGLPPKHLNYLDPASDYWRLYPDMPAADFVRFIALAQRGQPAPLEQVILPPGRMSLPARELGEQLKAQQRRHFEESVRYCRDVLGVT